MSNTLSTAELLSDDEGPFDWRDDPSMDPIIETTVEELHIVGEWVNALANLWAAWG